MRISNTMVANGYAQGLHCHPLFSGGTDTEPSRPPPDDLVRRRAMRLDEVSDLKGHFPHVLGD
jgi:hypothetical protein